MRIAVWGTGAKCKELLLHLQNCQVVAFIETTPSTKTYMGKRVCTLNEICDGKLDLIVISVIRAGQIEKFITERYPKIKEKCAFLFLQELQDFTFFYYQYRLLNNIVEKDFLDQCNCWNKEILRFNYKVLLYQNNLNDEELELIEYAKNQHLLQKLNYNFVEKYINQYYNVKLSEEGMYYIEYLDRKIFFPRKWNRKRIISYWNELMLDTDAESPLNEKDYEGDVSGIIMQIDYAVPIWVIKNINRCNKAYIINSDDEWKQALEMTFQDTESKCQIVQSINNIKGKRIDCCRININEDVKLVTEKLTSRNNVTQYIVTSYFHEKDYMLLSGLLKRRGYHVRYSNGYVYYPYNEEIIGIHKFRRGLLIADQE